MSGTSSLTVAAPSFIALPPNSRFIAPSTPSFWPSAWALARGGIGPSPQAAATPRALKVFRAVRRLTRRYPVMIVLLARPACRQARRPVPRARTLDKPGAADPACVCAPTIPGRHYAPEARSRTTLGSRGHPDRWLCPRRGHAEGSDLPAMELSGGRRGPGRGQGDPGQASATPLRGRTLLGLHHQLRAVAHLFL